MSSFEMDKLKIFLIEIYFKGRKQDPIVHISGTYMPR